MPSSHRDRAKHDGTFWIGVVDAHEDIVATIDQTHHIRRAMPRSPA